VAQGSGAHCLSGLVSTNDAMIAIVDLTQLLSASKSATGEEVARVSGQPT
jgi:hypothetical protein